MVSVTTRGLSSHAAEVVRVVEVSVVEVVCVCVVSLCVMSVV